MPTVKYSVSAYTADGTTTDYLITWDYLDDDHITVEVDGVSNDDPQANHTFVKLNDTTVRVTDGIGGAIAAGSEIQIRRNTPITTRPISFADGSALLASDLNKNSDYLLYAMQEALDDVDFTVQYQEEAEGFKDATEALRDQTATYLATVQSDAADADNHRIAAALSETNAATSETNAATSETNAATSATNAATSETNAASSAAAALTSEGAAATSATNAATSETNAAASAAAAAASESGVAADAATATAEATAAATSEANALIYKNNAAASATNAANSESNSATSASAAATSATNAAGSATAAGISEGNAQTYATNSQASATAASTAELNAEASKNAAATSAANAATSETNAATSATSAQSSADAALAALDSFDDRYLGQKATDPTVDNDGNALVTGSLYYDTTNSSMKVWDGSVWVSAYTAATGYLAAANNLTDLSDTDTARTNLGLTTASSGLANVYRTITQVQALSGQQIFYPQSGYTVDYLDVYWNGARLAVGTDFTATNGTSITVSAPTSYGDVIEMVAFGVNASGTTPTISSISGYINEDTGSNLTITGTGFAAGATVQLINYSTGVIIRNSPTVTVNSATEIVAATGATSTAPIASGTRVTIRVTNADGYYVEAVDALVVEADPVFQDNSGTLVTTTDVYSTVSTQVTAISPTGEVTYSVTSGALPTGLSLSTAGVISGTPSQVASSTTSTFDITATTDGQTGSTSVRSFNIIVNPTADGTSATRAAADASSIITATGSAVDGTYWININGTARQIYCDQTTDGGGWMLVYEVTNPIRNSSGEAQFTTDNSSYWGSSFTNFTRFAYRQQNNMGNGATSYYAFVSGDKFTGLNPETIRPWDAVRTGIHQSNFNNIHVVSNYDSSYVSNVSTDGQTGRIESWNWNYGTDGASAFVEPNGNPPNGYTSPFSDGSTTTYDWNDSPSYDSGGGYGCLQLFNMSPGTPQTLTAWNHHRAPSFSTAIVGFGTNDSSNPFYDSGGDPDWTFADNGAYNFKHQGWIK